MTRELLFAELRPLLLNWKIKSPRRDPEHYVICTHDGSPVYRDDEPPAHGRARFDREGRFAGYD